ncbi:ImmA/IrrE family metallo-endopeptidase [uncultured Thiodictyon sp.]|uniref:helix-turn-helix domain-containing protein n=1 Tax=uncultured Thiodictyon sp. TaxID=1846217 RepID=UPI0025E6D1B0|nr:ImmA/IrrE family metallo-endopeptidase [uncultured Thiodictyon sp.]
MTKTLNPEMVVLAREYRNWTQEKLAASVLVGQGTIAKIEGGVGGEVQPPVIDRIAKALDFPVEFFFQNEERLGFGSSAYFYRKKAKISAADRKRISGVVNLTRIHLKKLLSAVDIEAKRPLPSLDIADYHGDAGCAARVIRAIWSLPDGPIKDMTALIESAGVIVVPCEFGTRAMDATSLRFNDMPPLVFINQEIPGDRWRFTLAHELAHLVLHDTPTEQMEDEADAFAAEFLMPDSELRPQFSRIERIRIQDLANLKPFWKVSMGALLVRANNLGFMNPNSYRYLWMQMAQMGFKTKEPNPIAKENIQNYPNLFAYFKSLGYSLDDLCKTILAFRNDVESLHRFAMILPTATASHLRVVR